MSSPCSPDPKTIRASSGASWIYDAYPRVFPPGTCDGGPRGLLDFDAARRPVAADIAATAGYYDQSHMTAEFRHFMGVPAAAFTAGRRLAPTPCTA
ncbi:hypothetical protein [Streptomyces sp. NPDC096311]|uniref:hypothetical protein n=1 Tax=Streptomyces sp. NPDC096311 TaxID=3366083 RepID=UPI00381FC072